MATCSSCGVTNSDGAQFCAACGRKLGEAAPVSSLVAKCALHPDRNSRLTCSRCGSFACAECVSATPELCKRCETTAGIPWSRLRAVAQAQRFVIQMFALGLLSLPAAGVITALVGTGELANFAFVAVFLLVRGTMAFAVYKLASELNSGLPALWAVGAFIPNIVGMIVLLIISSRASTFLQKAGIKVGLMGASLAETPPPR